MRRGQSPKLITCRCKYGCGARLRRPPQSAPTAACRGCQRKHHILQTNAARAARRAALKLSLPQVEPDAPRPTPKQIMDYAYWGN